MDEIKIGLIIGTSELEGLPGKKFYLVRCYECGNLFNSQVFEGEINCVNCHKKIKLTQEVKNG